MDRWNTLQQTLAASHTLELQNGQMEHSPARNPLTGCFPYFRDEALYAFQVEQAIELKDGGAQKP